MICIHCQGRDCTGAREPFVAIAQGATGSNCTPDVKAAGKARIAAQTLTCADGDRR